jgi:hypothetical protein
VKYEAS